MEIMKFKICLLGDPAVGKTSLVKKYVYSEFDEKYLSTMGAVVSKKEMIVSHPVKKENINLTMMIWDIMGQTDYKGLHKSYLKDARGALVVCDFTRPQTKENLGKWTDMLYEKSGKVPVIFLANKCDLEDQFKFTIEDVEEVAKGYDAQAFKSSAKTGENVQRAFYTLGLEILKKI